MIEEIFLSILNKIDKFAQDPSQESKVLWSISFKTGSSPLTSPDAWKQVVSSQPENHYWPCHCFAPNSCWWLTSPPLQLVTCYSLGYTGKSKCPVNISTKTRQWLDFEMEGFCVYTGRHRDSTGCCKTLKHMFDTGAVTMIPDALHSIM